MTRLQELFENAFRAQEETLPSYYGFIPEPNEAHDRHDDLLHCAVVGMLIFTASCGCVMGLLTEFELSVNFPLIILILFMASMYLSFIHISRLFYNLGYFMFLMFFTFSLFSFRSYANSGYQALLNTINKAYSDHFLLTSTREYTELLSDRYTTVTAMSIFIGLFLVLLLNVGIFNDMFFFTTFNLTFWPLQIGIYIGRYPSYISLVLLFIAYFGVYFLRHSGHFYFVQPPRRNKPRQYSFDFDDNEGRPVVFHKSNARAMTALCVFALIVSLLFSIFCTFAVSSSESEAQITRSALKSRLDDSVKIFTQTGLMGLFNRYQAKGGINGGKLGGVRSVAPDYETDLLVTFVPHSFETMYLKGYVGHQYTGSQWNPPSNATGYNTVMRTASGPAAESTQAKERILLESSNLNMLMSEGLIDENSAGMTIKNVDAATGYIYAPYYISSIPDKALTDSRSVLKGFSAIDGEETYSFTPFYSTIGRNILSGEPVRSQDAVIKPPKYDNVQEYDEEVYANYLQIPFFIKEELDAYHDKIGTADTVGGQIDLIYDYFLNNYTYDMAPGATPYNTDFVTYFLKDQKRGYCAHFASAGTMLLRSYGIPARYVEGYVITTSDITENSDTTDFDSDLYFSGKNPLGQSVVMKTEVSDGNAHAWTEVYVCGFGWIPVDFTVPATEDSIPSYAEFLSSLTRLFGPGVTEDENDTADSSDTAQDPGISKVFRFKNNSVIIVFLAILLVLMLIPVAKALVRNLLLYLKYRQAYLAGDHAEMVSHYYRKAVKHLSLKYIIKTSGMVDDTFDALENMLTKNNEASARIAGFLTLNGTDLGSLRLLTLSCFYSDKKLGRPDADLLIKFFKHIAHCRIH